MVLIPTGPKKQQTSVFLRRSLSLDSTQYEWEFRVLKFEVINQVDWRCYQFEYSTPMPEWMAGNHAVRMDIEVFAFLSTLRGFWVQLQSQTDYPSCTQLNLNQHLIGVYLSRRCTSLLHSNSNWFSWCGSQSTRSESICFFCCGQFKDGQQQHWFRGDFSELHCMEAENAKENCEMLLMSSWCIMKASNKWSLATGIRHLSKECYNFKFHNHLARDKQKHNVVFGFFSLFSCSYFPYFFLCFFLFSGRNLSHFINILELSLYSTSAKTNNV